MKLQIKVRPNSSRQEIQTNLDGKITKVFLKKPARENKSNIELEKLLSKYYTSKFRNSEHAKCRKAKVKIIKGHTSKTKIIEVT